MVGKVLNKETLVWEKENKKKDSKKAGQLTQVISQESCRLLFKKWSPLYP